MRKIGLLKSELYINIIKVIAWLFLLTYVPFMFVIPWFYGDWNYVHGVWHSWQSLNVGILAFLATVIALYVSRYQSIEHTKREFEGEKAFLPHALGELCKYLNSSALVLISVLPPVRGNMSPNLNIECPILPLEQFTVFKNCIKFAEPAVAKYLVNLLKLLQIHHSRLESICTQNYANAPYARSCLYNAAEIQALINELYDFARSEADFKAVELDWEMIRVAYRNLGVIYENIESLERYSKEQFTRLSTFN